MFLFHFSLHDKYLLLLIAARVQGKLRGKHEVSLRLLSIPQNCCTRMVTGPDGNCPNSPPVLGSELRFCLLQLNFTAFHVENHSLCKWDSVTILNGGTPGSPVIGRYCGNESPGIIQSGSNKLLVIFNSDHSIQGGGFYATWTAESLGKKKITLFSWSSTAIHHISPALFKYKMKQDSSFLIKFVSQNTINTCQHLQHS